VRIDSQNDNPTPSGADQAEMLRSVFDEPFPDYSPTPFWWWSGEPLELQRLIWQLDRLVEGGIYNLAVIHLAPAGPMFGTRGDQPLYFTEEWWTIFRGMCEHARKIGVKIWFYGQLGVAGANVQGRLVMQRPEFRGEKIDRLVYEGTGPCALQLPKGTRFVSASALACDTDGCPTGRPEPLAVEADVVHWQGSNEPGRVILAYARPYGFDYLSREAGAALIDVVHGEFARRLGDLIGETVIGSFHEEFPRLGLWSREFLGAFQDRCGYDLAPLVAALWEDWGPEARKIRRDYQRVRTALAEESYFKPIFEWHERRGMLLGSDAQEPARDGPPIESSQLYGDYMQIHRWVSAPGTDHGGELKIHSSLAHLHRRPRVWLCAFHSSGWGGTLQETFDWLLPGLLAGATLYNQHAVYYSTKGGWFDWAPPSTCWRQPYWRHYRIYARAVSRLCAALAQGTHRCDVAVLFPTSTVQAHVPLDLPTNQLKVARAPSTAGLADKAQDSYFEIVGHMKWENLRPGILDRDRRDFDIIDDAALAGATVEGGTLRIADETYRALILPAIDVLDIDAARAAVRFAESGGLLIAIGSLPRETSSLDRQSVARLRELAADGRVRLVDTAENIIAALSDLARTVDAPVPTLLRQVGEEYVLFVPAIYPNATDHPMGSGEGEWAVSSRVASYRFDAGRYPAAMSITVRGLPGMPALWDPVDGTRKRLRTRALANGLVEVIVPFDNLPAALIVWQRQGGVEELPLWQERAQPHARIDLNGLWDVDYVFTQDNRWGDFDRPLCQGPPPLRLWTMGHRSDPNDVGLTDCWQGSAEADWRPVRATYGPHALSVGPLPLADLPEPLSEQEARAVARGEGELAAAEWLEHSYSCSRGMEKDKWFWLLGGPKGYIPTEFLTWPAIGEGQAVQMRCLVLAAPGRRQLIVGAGAKKQVFWNGQPLAGHDAGHWWYCPIDVGDGPNVLEIRLFGPVGGYDPSSVRACWTLAEEAADLHQAEWIQPDDEPSAGSRIMHCQAFALESVPARADAIVGTPRPGRFLVNGSFVDQLIEDGYYEDDLVGTPSVFRYEIARLLRPGRNEIAIETLDLGSHRPVYLDLAVVEADGTRFFVSGADWNTERDGVAVGTAVNRDALGDPLTVAVRPRPHPLPDAEWLGDVPPDPAREIRSFAGLRGGVEWFRFILPPGATTLTVPVHGRVRCWVDGLEQACADEMVHLSAGAGPRVMVLRVEAEPGFVAGAMWREAPRVVLGPGRLDPRDWQEAGLVGYSGGIVYRRTVHLMQEEAVQIVELDLGAVRGTVEATVNGRPLGSKIFGPWRFDMRGCLRPGENRIEITVFNTLGAYLSEHSPAALVFPNQLVAGLLGPVTFGLRAGANLEQA